MLSLLLAHPLLASAAVLVTFILFIVIKSRSAGLEHIPSPFLAKYTNAWRCFYAWKDLDTGTSIQWKAFKKYGDVFRTGPNTVTVLDPEAVPGIFGVKARLEKVNTDLSSTRIVMKSIYQVS